MSFDLRVIIYRRRWFYSALIQAVCPSLGKIPACRQTFCHVGVFLVVVVVGFFFFKSVWRADVPHRQTPIG